MRVTPWLALVLLVAACDFDGHGTPVDGGPSIDATDGPDAAPGDDDDQDGILNPNDNCRGEFNPDQHDEDVDGVGDRCDNCPTVSNANQANTGETTAGQAADQAGDVCDPFPDRPGNAILFYDVFTSRDPLWLAKPGPGVWNVTGDAMVQTDLAGVAYLYYAGDLHGDVVVDITARVVTPPVSGGFGMGSTAQWNLSPGHGAGYLCQLFDTVAGAGDGPLNVGDFLLRSAAEAVQIASRVHTSIVPAVTPADAWTVRHSAIASSRSCSAASSAGFRITTPTVSDATVPTGRFGLRAAAAAIRFENIVVYTVGP